MTVSKTVPFPKFFNSQITAFTLLHVTTAFADRYLLQKFRGEICNNLTEHLPSLLVLVQGFQGAPLDAEHTILYLQSMTSSYIKLECVIDPV